MQNEQEDHYGELLACLLHNSCAGRQTGCSIAEVSPQISLASWCSSLSELIGSQPDLPLYAYFWLGRSIGRRSCCQLIVLRNPWVSMNRKGKQKDLESATTILPCIPIVILKAIDHWYSNWVSWFPQFFTRSGMWQGQLSQTQSLWIFQSLGALRRPHTSQSLLQCTISESKWKSFRSFLSNTILGIASLPLPLMYTAVH